MDEDKEYTEGIQSLWSGLAVNTPKCRNTDCDRHAPEDTVPYSREIKD